MQWHFLRHSKLYPNWVDGTSFPLTNVTALVSLIVGKNIVAYLEDHPT